MTDIVTTTRFASRPVIDFLRDTTPARRAGYLSRGKPQCLEVQYMAPEGFITRLHAGLRGVRIGDAVETPEEAIARANGYRADLLAGDLEHVDEQALGIDDEAVDLAQRFHETGARMERIVHIGSMLDDEAGPLAEALGDIVADIRSVRKQARSEAPLLATVDDRAKASQPEVPAVAKDLPALLKLAEMAGRPRQSELVEEFSMIAHDEGAMGFLVEVSVPEHVPHKDGRGASVHGGIRRTAWRYASTYGVAADRALEWADGEIRRMWPEYRGST